MKFTMLIYKYFLQQLQLLAFERLFLYFYLLIFIQIQYILLLFYLSLQTDVNKR